MSTTATVLGSLGSSAHASVPAVKELLGHANLSTTATYVEVDIDDLRRAVEKLERRQLARP